MPFIKIYIHIEWGTKNRVAYLDTIEKRKQVWKHIKDNAKKKGIFLDYVNGYNDHCHCLISLGVDQTIQKVVQLIKGESSFWINKQGFTSEKFEWQDEYFAVSVSESMIDIVRNYINNQEMHHKTKTFEDEYDEFILKHNFKILKDSRKPFG